MLDAKLDKIMASIVGIQNALMELANSETGKDMDGQIENDGGDRESSRDDNGMTLGK